MTTTATCASPRPVLTLVACLAAFLISCPNARANPNTNEGGVELHGLSVTAARDTLLRSGGGGLLPAEWNRVAADAKRYLEPNSSPIATFNYYAQLYKESGGGPVLALFGFQPYRAFFSGNNVIMAIPFVMALLALAASFYFGNSSFVANPERWLTFTGLKLAGLYFVVFQPPMVYATVAMIRDATYFAVQYAATRMDDTMPNTVSHSHFSEMSDTVRFSIEVERAVRDNMGVAMQFPVETLSLLHSIARESGQPYVSEEMVRSVQQISDRTTQIDSARVAVTSNMERVIATSKPVQQMLASVLQDRAKNRKEYSRNRRGAKPSQWDARNREKVYRETVRIINDYYRSAGLTPESPGWGERIKNAGNDLVDFVAANVSTFSPIELIRSITFGVTRGMSNLVVPILAVIEVLLTGFITELYVFALFFTYPLIFHSSSANIPKGMARMLLMAALLLGVFRLLCFFWETLWGLLIAVGVGIFGAGAAAAGIVAFAAWPALVTGGIAFLVGILIMVLVYIYGYWCCIRFAPKVAQGIISGSLQIGSTLMQMANAGGQFGTSMANLATAGAAGAGLRAAAALGIGNPATSAFQNLAKGIDDSPETTTSPKSTNTTEGITPKVETGSTTGSDQRTPPPKTDTTANVPKGTYSATEMADLLSKAASTPKPQ